jgi:cbb3-type cytochrome oxidase maturation protein
MLSLLLFSGVGLALFALCLGGLAWAVRTGQLDDLETPALRMLTDDDTAPIKDRVPHE